MNERAELPVPISDRESRLLQDFRMVGRLLDRRRSAANRELTRALGGHGSLERWAELEVRAHRCRLILWSVERQLRELWTATRTDPAEPGKAMPSNPGENA